MALDSMRIKSFEEHHEFLTEIVRLKGWFLWNWLRAHPEESLARALHWRVNVIGYMPFFPGGYPTDQNFKIREWVELEAQVNAAYEDTQEDLNANKFETAVVEIFAKCLLMRAEMDRNSLGQPPNWRFRCLDLEGPTDEYPRTVFVHITNSLAPRSILDDSKYLIECLLSLMEHAKTEFGVDSLRTTSWLNSLPGWLRFFPHDWQRNMGNPITDVAFGDQFWGQFVNARGCFNHRYAEMKRQEGTFPFANRHACCSFQSLQAHLKKMAC